MSRVVLLSDVHLTDQHSDTNDSFLSFIKNLNTGGVDGGASGESLTRALYILGDLFDVWVGDDVPSAIGDAVAQALSELNERGAAVFIQHGNRDFMLGARFISRCRATLLPPAYVLETGGERWLLMHGDELTGDAEYMRYRAIIRHPITTAAYSVLPVFMRQKIAARLRAASKGGAYNATADGGVATQALKRHSCANLIHGHLHRREYEEWQAATGEQCRRWCLPAWEGGAQYGEIADGKLTIISAESNTEN